MEQPSATNRNEHFVAAQIEPKLVKLYEQAEGILEEEAMANGAVNVAKENWQQIRNLVTTATDVFDEHELDAVPRIRQRFKSGIEQGVSRQRIDDLLKVLQRRSIQLSQTQETRLRKLTNGKLPEMDAALDATSAADFMRRAGLFGRARIRQRRAKQEPVRETHDAVGFPDNASSTVWGHLYLLPESEEPRRSAVCNSQFYGIDLTDFTPASGDGSLFIEVPYARDHKFPAGGLINSAWVLEVGYPN